MRKNLIISAVAVFALALVFSAVIIRKSYTDNLRPLSGDNRGIVVTINPGSTTSQVADELKDRGIIRSDWAFEWFIRNHQLGGEIKAGTYLLNQSQDIPAIVQILIEGKVRQDLITILPAQRLDQIRQYLIDKGFGVADVDSALKPSAYPNHPALTDKPKNGSLEGYLYPESFLKTDTTTAKQIIKLSLDEMSARLTPEIRQAFSKGGLTVHQAITLASIVEQEVSSDYDRARAAQVFLKRYRSGIALQSDPTAHYEARKNGDPERLDYPSLYNTYLHAGLPLGPIGNVSKSSLEAVAYPAETSWLYFVAGEDCVTRFSRTNAEHDALIEKYGVRTAKTKCSI